MNKKALFLSAAIASSIMMITGVQAEETAQSIMTKYTEASAAVTETNAAIKMNGDLSANIADYGMSIDAKGTGSMDVAASLDPFKASVTGEFSGNAMGMDGSISVATYMVPGEDGNLITYTNADGEWVAATASALSLDSLQEYISKAKDMDFSDMPLAFALEDGTVDINGTECYALKAAMDWASVKEYINWSLDKVNEAGLTDTLTDTDSDEYKEALSQMQTYLDMADPYAAGIVLNVEMDIDANTYLPVRVYADLNSSDWSNLLIVASSALGLTNEDGSAMDIDLTVNDLSMECIYDYETPVDIVVPEEALSAEVISADDLTSSLVETAMSE